MAGVTRVELATSCVTGMRSNQLSYTPIKIYMVPGAGIEPARYQIAQDFKSCASTYSATQAS